MKNYLEKHVFQKNIRSPVLIISNILFFRFI